MDHRELKKLVQLMNDNGLIELELEQEGFRVSLRKPGPPVFTAAPQAAFPLPASVAMPLAPGPAAGEAPAPGAPAEVPGTRVIPSPMVGTFYRRPSPESEPYVEVGDVVEPETVVCIVEAMKVNNEIKAEMAGEIVEILVDDGQPVEFDEPLFRVKVA